jgi:hypothetical protein
MKEMIFFVIMFSPLLVDLLFIDKIQSDNNIVPSCLESANDPLHASSLRVHAEKPG